MESFAEKILAAAQDRNRLQTDSHSTLYAAYSALRRAQPRAPPASARAANFDFDDVLLLLFDTFKVAEATRDILRENEITYSRLLERLTEETLIRLGLK